jgi:probable HAF family extracellular repeat protein
MKKTNGRLAILATAVMVTASFGIAYAQSPECTRPSKEPVALGTLGGDFSLATAANVFGKVVGYSEIADDAAQHAFVTTDGNKLKDIGLLSTGVNSAARGINAEGQIVGAADINDPVAGLVLHPFLYRNGGPLKDLGTLGGAIGQATGISDLGAVVGFSLLGDEATTHAFLYHSRTNGLVDLGTLPGGSNSQALAVNDRGYAAGSSDTGNTDQFGNIITDAVLFNLKTKEVTDLGNLGGTPAQAFGINNCGLVVGSSVTASGLTDAFVYENGALKDIGTLGGSFAQANAVNDFGVVVGFSNITGDTDVHAFVWTAAKGMVDLNSLLPTNSGWDLSAAYGINLEGKIVGVGTFNGESQAFEFTYRP